MVSFKNAIFIVYLVMIGSFQVHASNGMKILKEIKIFNMASDNKYKDMIIEREKDMRILFTIKRDENNEYINNQLFRWRREIMFDFLSKIMKKAKIVFKNTRVFHFVDDLKLDFEVRSCLQERIYKFYDQSENRIHSLDDLIEKGKTEDCFVVAWDAKSLKKMLAKVGYVVLDSYAGSNDD